jgi:large subunit ribosomal protein L5
MSAITLTAQDFYTQGVQELSKQLKTKNPFALSNIAKVSINVGMGRFDAKQKAEIVEYLEKLTGQKPKVVSTNLSIAGFKIRKGDQVGVVVTLRGIKMKDFLLNLIYVALPRTKDFKGIKKAAFDKQNSTYSLGIENASIFPQIGFDSTVIFGMQVNIVFRTKSENNKLLLDTLHVPFVK